VHIQNDNGHRHGARQAGDRTRWATGRAWRQSASADSRSAFAWRWSELVNTQAL